MDGSPLTLPAGSFALEGPARSGKTKHLVERTLQLLCQEGSNGVWVLCSNYYRKNQFLEAVQDGLAKRAAQGADPSLCTAQLHITTYSALVRNTLSQFWPLVEDLLENSSVTGDSVIFPELCGFEVSEYLLWELIQQARRTDELFMPHFIGSDLSLIRQLLRRVRLRTENRLSHSEMTQRSLAIGEEDIDTVDQLLRQYERLATQCRTLDNSRQIEAFIKLAETHPVVSQYFQNTIEHLIVDDVDETIPAQQGFIKWIAPTLKTLTLAADLQGGTRRGYLNAYPYDWQALCALKPDLQQLTLTRQDTAYAVAEQIKLNWKGLLRQQPKPLPASGRFEWKAQTHTRMDMLLHAIEDIHQYLKQTNARPGQLAIVLPVVDPLAQTLLKDSLERHGYPVQLLTGTHRPVDHPVCQSLLTCLQLVNQHHWHQPLSPISFRAFLRQALKLHWIDPLGLENLVSLYRNQPDSGLNGLPLNITLQPAAQARYQLLLEWIEEARDLPIADQLYSAFSTLIAPQLTADNDLEDVHHLIRSLLLHQVTQQLYPSMTEKEAGLRWFLHVQQGLVADSPSKPNEVDSHAIVIATPQKIIDFEIERSTQLWLDVSSREWARTDSAPLYNAWVHSVHWDGVTTDITDDIHQDIAHTRAAHICRTLSLYANDTLWLYAAHTDDEGQPNQGALPSVLRLETKAYLPIERATLREDQAPILAYRGGPMAISAVPGAGKTFINIELVLQLIEQGVAPHQILVLTYMDSAANTMRDRLQAKLGISQLGSGQPFPTISTIHSLAYRMLLEDDHAVLLGLDPSQMTILDEFERNRLIEDTFNHLYAIEHRPFKPYVFRRLLDLAKAYCLDAQAIEQLAQQHTHPKFKNKLLSFAQLFKVYETTQHRNGSLDFTDLIVLAIRLLETQPKVRAHYQQLFQVVIEDEAQDSSVLLQRMLGLLLRQDKSFVRTGDTNQSITTTFSTADTSVFRSFIEACRSNGIVVTMNRSGRCAPEVMHLANGFMASLSHDEILRNAFEPVTMAPVKGHNPSLMVPLTAQLFETEDQELAWIIDTIKTAQASNQKLSVAVLLRRNETIDRWAPQLQEAGLHVWTSVEKMAVIPVLSLFKSLLLVLSHPNQPQWLIQLCDQLEALGWLTLSETERQRLGASGLLLQPVDQLHGQFSGEFIQLLYHLHNLMGLADHPDISRLLIYATQWLIGNDALKTVGYLCAQSCRQWQSSRFVGEATTSALERVLSQLEQTLQRGQVPFKITSNSLDPDAIRPSGAVELMTLHKAKGQEFDLVFIPGMTELLFPSHPNQLQWRDEDQLECELKQLLDPAQSNEAELAKLAKIEEEARLVYVGLTRAKRGLYVSCPMAQLQWKRMQPQQPSRYFELINQLIAAPASAGVQPHSEVSYA